MSFTSMSLLEDPDVDFNANSNVGIGVGSRLFANFNVEALTLPDLMKNRIVRTMYADWQNASNQLVRDAQMKDNLYQENLRLTAQVNALQGDRQSDVYVAHIPLLQLLTTN